MANLAKTSNPYRHLVILHSNDLHADFIADEKKEQVIGGFPYLAGYVAQARRFRPKSTLYFVAGDLFSGNLIDYDSKGVQSVKIMNELAPDAVCIGNHSVDHTLQRLAFLEHLSDFPVINANLYVKELNRPFFEPYKIIRKNGINILLIGIVTDEIMRRKGKDKDLGEFVEYRDPANEIRRILSEVDTTDIDLKIILSHIGYKEDKKLADQLDPSLGIDMIIGGHSHTLPEEAVVQNNIIVVQAGKKSKQIGRFELTVDTSSHKLTDWRWDILPIESGRGTKVSSSMDLKINEYQKEILRKYDIPVISLAKKLVKEEYRYEENIIGDFFTDVLKNMFGVDVCLIGSGSLRTDELGPVMTRLQLRNMYSVNEVLYKIPLTGEQLRRGMKYALEHAPYSMDEDGEYYQVDTGCKFHLETMGDQSMLTIAEVCDAPIEDNRVYSVAIEDFHYYNLHDFMGFSKEEIPEYEILTVDTNGDIENYLRNHQDYQPCLELGERTKRTTKI